MRYYGIQSYVNIILFYQKIKRCLHDLQKKYSLLSHKYAFFSYVRTNDADEWDETEEAAQKIKNVIKEGKPFNDEIKHCWDKIVAFSLVKKNDRYKVRRCLINRIHGCIIRTQYKLLTIRTQEKITWGINVGIGFTPLIIYPIYNGISNKNMLAPPHNWVSWALLLGGLIGEAVVLASWFLSSEIPELTQKLNNVIEIEKELKKRLIEHARPLRLVNKQ